MKLKDFDKQSLAIIDNSSILEKSDFEKILALKDELNDTFLHTQVFRTRTEMEISVLDDIHFPTPDSKYWQSMREQNVHYNELVSLSYDYRKNIIEIKQLEKKLKAETDELEAELLRIEIDRKNFTRLQQERVAKDRIREIQQWHEIKQRLVPQMRCGLIDVGEHQLVSYAIEFTKEVMNMPASTGIAEKNNAIGKLITTLRVIKEKGLGKEVARELSNKEISYLRDNGIDI